MNNLKYAINEMVKKPLILILIILQTAIGTCILSPGILQSIKAYDLYTKSKNTLNRNDMYSISYSDSFRKEKNIDKDPDKGEKIFSLYKKLKTLNNGTVVSYNFSNIIIEKFTDKDKFYSNPTDKGKYVLNPIDSVQGKFSDIKALYVDNSYASNFPFNIENGRTLKKEDFDSEDVYPILLGADYKGIYKIGDEFEHFDYRNSMSLKKLKVVGILDRYQYMFDRSGIETLDDKVICPIQDIKSSENCNEKVMPWLSSINLITSNKNKSAEEIRSISDTLGLYSFNLISMQKEKQNLINFTRKDLKAALLLNSVILLFIAFGIITVQLNSIKDKRIEYGTHLLCGASKKDIILRNIYSVVIYLGIGTLIGSYIEYKKLMMNDGHDYDSRVFIVIFVIYLILVIIISYVPCRKLKKLQVNDVVRGLSE